MLAPSTPFHECKLYVLNTPSVGIANQWLWEIVEYETNRQEYSAISSRIELVSQVVKVHQINRALKGRITQILEGYSSSGMR